MALKHLIMQNSLPFFNSVLTLLRMLTHTKSAFEEHLKHTAYATVTGKLVHIVNNNLPPLTEYGFKV